MINYFKLSKFFLYIVPLAVVIVTPSTLFPFIVGKYVWFKTSIDLALIFFLLGLLFQSKEVRPPRGSTSQKLRLIHEEVEPRKVKIPQILKSPLVIAVSIFVAIFLLACFFGVDPKMSFWSNFERGEGGLQMIHLWLFFILLVLLFKEEKDWQRLFIMAIIGGLGMALYGLLAGTGTENFIGPKFSDPGFRFSGSIGNPAYVAAYAIFMIFYAAYLLASRYKNRLLSFGAIILFGLVILFLIVFFAAATRGAFLGLIASILVFIGYLAFSSQRWRKWLLSGIVIMLLVIGSLVYFKNTPFVKSLPGSRIFDISFSAETFQHRTIMWKIAIDGWKERPLLGWGPENYIKIFDRHFNIKYFEPDKGFGAWFDRAHSIYFDYLAETGILGLLSFLSIFAVFYWQFFKKTRKNQFQEVRPPEIKRQYLGGQTSPILESALIFALPVAYLVQGIVLFDVLPIYMNIFLFLAFASYYFNKTPNLNR